ncbi:MAG: hypothetical protein IKA02_00245 [Clostridia bacterium]|nr:hypothetical protein [Clostridia bacterium]
MAIIKSDNLTEYEIIDELGKGGFGTVYEVRRISDGKKFAFKFFEQSDDAKMRLIHSNIKNNVSNLINRPIKYSDGTYLVGFVRPLEMVTNTSRKGFGYIMDFINLGDCATIFRSWKDAEKFRPDALETCQICKAIAHVFDKIHASGRSYKDVSEGNLCFNLKEKKIYVMDCDNVGAGNIKTIFGTPKFIAPEVYDTGYPNSISDRYSMAVFFYRLMVGGYPLEGKKTVAYLVKNGLDADQNFEAAYKIYNKEALFAFDENDTSNSIQAPYDPIIPQEEIETWKIQTFMWSLLPESIKKMFLRVFSENLKGDAKDRRPTETQWIDTFNDIINNGIVKCKCGRHNYLGNENCLFCGKKLPTAPQPKAVAKVIPENAVKYKVVSSKNSKEIYTDKLDGSEVSAVFNKGQIILESVLFSGNKNMMKVKNQSGYRINITYPTGTNTYCVDSASAFLMIGSELEIETSKSTIRLRVECFNLKKS